MSYISRMSENIFSKKATDSWPIAQRAMLLKETILPAIWDATGKVFQKDDLLSARGVLDVSCGRGSLGLAIRQMKSSAGFVGVDTYDYGRDPETPTAWYLYDGVRVGSIRDAHTVEWLQSWSYDVVMAICTHPDVYSFLAKNVGSLPINIGGKVVFISEVGLDGVENYGFWRGVGREYGYQIGVYTK